MKKHSFVAAVLYETDGSGKIKIINSINNPSIIIKIQ